MQIRYTDGSGFDQQVQEADFAVIVISREDVEAPRVDGTAQRLTAFSDDPIRVHRFAGRMLVQVNGYDGDPRPLVQIPECVRFFRALDARWGYWLHFLLPEPDVLKLILLMLVDVEPQPGEGGQVGYALRHPAQLVPVLRRLFHAMNALHDTFGVPSAHNEAMTAAALAALGLPGARGSCSPA
ncbi:hypothetical protein [Paracidovorax anthurii]|uniref:Uncharacterized protein n=1 Tax=Paracidovorax anthurii TaxID=78229 RepID=A0A328ZE17_9BURK|nr:hypothetical protein [Paracidovorax anthurii]RAR81017.1 hypothetical protein AX018_102133 [Paracidovorax anthurii]